MALTDRDRRTLRIGGVIVGVLLVGFLLSNLLSGGGTESAGPTSGPIIPTSTASPGSTETPTLSPSTTPGPFSGRDPFSIPPGLGETGGSGGPTDGTSTPPTSTPPTSGPPTSGPPTSGPPTSPTQTPTQPGQGSSATIGGHEVVLLDVFTLNGASMVQVEVDGHVYSVAVGETFAGGVFELRSTRDNCATFVFGDESFVLCVTPNK